VPRASFFAAASNSSDHAMASGDFDPDGMLRVLHEAGVRFILIGGMAAVLHGDVGVTIDLDVVPEHTADNFERLARALRSMVARIRAKGEPDGLMFDCSADFFRSLPSDAIINLTTRMGDLDLAFCPSGTQGYTDLRRDALEIESVDGIKTLVSSLADVIRSKEAAGREKDRAALPRLRRLLERIDSDED